MTNLGFCLVAEVLDAVSSIESGTDLFVCVNETLELGVQFDVLAGEDVTVVLESVDFGPHVAVLSLHGLRRESKLILLSLPCIQVVLSGSALGFQVVQVGGEISVAGEFALGTAHQL